MQSKITQHMAMREKMNSNKLRQLPDPNTVVIRMLRLSDKDLLKASIKLLSKCL